MRRRRYADDKGYPLFEEAEGRSLIVSRTGKGEDLVRSAIEAGYIMAQNLDVAEISKMQPSQARRKQLVLSRLSAMALMGRVMPRFVGLRLCKAAFGASFWQHLRSFLGMVRRLLQSRARVHRWSPPQLTIMSPDVSIVIVSWNTCDVLRDCLRSITDQTTLLHEVIVIDKNSSDDTGGNGVT